MTDAATVLADGFSGITAPGAISEELRGTSREPIPPTDVVALFVGLSKGIGTLALSSATRIRDPWVMVEHTRTTTNGQTFQHHLISNLASSAEEAAEIRLRLLPFEDDWTAPGMDVYDTL